MDARLLGTTLLAAMLHVQAAHAGSGIDPRTPALRPDDCKLRILAELAIQRVYHAHRIGTSQPFERAVPDSAIERRILEDERQAVELSQEWGIDVDDEMLDRELERIRRDTRFPERLEEIEAALGHDPEKLREYYVRPRLVRRLVHALREADSPLPEAANHSIDVASTATENGECPAIGAWRSLPTEGGPGPRVEATAVWTGSEMIVWGGYGPIPSGTLDTGGSYDPVADAWSATALEGAPSCRYAHTAVWTGSEMLVWGGDGPGPGRLADGGRYDPVTDTWTPINTEGAPPPAPETHTTVWTGSEMLVWSRSTAGSGTVGIYDPATDQWRTGSGVGAPSSRRFHAAVWTGGEMLVWGGDGLSAGLRGDGAAYDPETDTWFTIAVEGAPAPRYHHVAAWTGSEMLVWGGTDTVWPADPYETNTGALYDPEQRTWRPTTLEGAPAGRARPTIVWSGTTAIVWGGANEPGTDLVLGRQDGGAYDPSTDTWLPTPLSAAPLRRYRHVAVWTGSEMLVWGGAERLSFGQTMSFRTVGGAHDPAAPTADRDADSFCDPLDCDDSNAAVWATPGEVTNLAFPSPMQIVWSPVSDPGATVVKYGVLRSRTPSDFYGEDCPYDPDTTDLTIEVQETPEPGEAYYYLVRARNACPGTPGFGTLGTGSDERPRGPDSRCPY